MAIRGRDALFVPILIPYMLGDFLKINSKENAKKNHECVVIGGANAIFSLIFKAHTSGDLLKINKKKRTKNHECVVFGGANARFLILNPDTLGNFLKINSKIFTREIIPAW